MGVDLSSIPLNARRAIEAELAQRVYIAALPSLGHAAALQILCDAIDEAARAAGRAFASRAPYSTPNLEHFSQVLRVWQTGGALSIENVELASESLSFCVTRCGYMEMYRELGLPAFLHDTLSCRRDAAFAEGYSPRLRLERPQTISAGAQSCLFWFRWLP
jgi:hypothetical protein